jgi:2-polyprenyl-3-methyl-5-hydroxy-6-metoxy-1,4-benzoquinol methylase
MKYAWDIFRTMIRAKFHEKNLLYDRKFDVGQVELTYDLKMDFPSSHTFAVGAVIPGAKVLDIGCGQGYVAKEMAAKAARVTGIDQYVPEEPPAPNVEFKRWDLDVSDFPVSVAEFDQIFMLDVIEHLHDPEVFMEMLRTATGRKRPEIVLTTANIGFFITRLMLFLGHFNYGRKGILDRTHTRLFTFNSLKELFEQTGYKVTEVQGVPAPFPKALGDNALGRFMVGLNQFLIKISRGLFSYQIFLRAQALPTVPALLSETIERSGEMKKAALAATA